VSQGLCSLCDRLDLSVPGGGGNARGAKVSGGVKWREVWFFWRLGPLCVWHGNGDEREETILNSRFKVRGGGGGSRCLMVNVRIVGTEWRVG